MVLYKCVERCLFNIRPSRPASINGRQLEMKDISFLLLIVTALSAAAFGQGRTFDNFDRSQGVQIVTPTYVPPPKANKKLVKRTGKATRTQLAAEAAAKSGAAMSPASGLASRESRMPTTKLVMGSNPHLNGFTTGNPKHDEYIVESSRRYRIDPLLIYAQMHQESSFKINATSHKGASGLMQLMPATARRFGVTKIYDPQQNIDAGIKYMRWLLDTFNGDVALALAGYNAGEGAVMKYGWNIPPYRETQEYVRRISARYNMISNPQYIQRARRIDAGTAAKLQQKEAPPLTVYAPAPRTVRLPNGQLSLAN